MRKILIKIPLLILALMLSGCSEITNKNMIPVEEANYEMSNYYFDSFELVEQEYDKDTETTYTTYDVTYEGESFSYNGQVELISEYYGDYWESYMMYCDDIEWDVEGHWVSDDSSAKDSTGYLSFAFNIKNVNEEEGTVEFVYDIYQYIYGNEIFVDSGHQTVEYVEDYTSEHTFDIGGYYQIVLSEEEMKAVRCGEPDFEFLFETENGWECVVTFSGNNNSVKDSAGWGTLILNKN